jgi:hypothetical protein
MTTHCQVVGYGPAALGLAVAADRIAALDRFLSRGVTFIDASPDLAALKRQRFPYVIESNSPGGEFLAGVSATGALRGVLSMSAARRLRAHKDRPAPLFVVGQLMNDLTDALGPLLRESPSRTLLDTRICRVERNPDGTFTSYTTDGRPAVTSRALVLATGGTEDVTTLAARYGLSAEMIVTSAAVLTDRLDRVAAAVRASQPIVVVGGSHSALSVANQIVERFGDALDDGQVTVAYRSILLGFSSLAEAHAWPHRVGGEIRAICPETGLVNRFRGARGDAKRLCAAVLAGTERRIRLCPLQTRDVARTMAQAGAVVQATGYRPAEVTLREANGNAIELRRQLGKVAVDPRCRLVARTGHIVERAFGIGIGYARASRSAESMVAINAFHGPDAEHIVTELLTGEG